MSQQACARYSVRRFRRRRSQTNVSVRFSESFDLRAMTNSLERAINYRQHEKTIRNDYNSIRFGTGIIRFVYVAIVRPYMNNSISSSSSGTIRVSQMYDLTDGWYSYTLWGSIPPRLWLKTILPSERSSLFRFDVEDRSYLTSTSGVDDVPAMINSGLLRNYLRMLLPVLLFLC